MSEQAPIDPEVAASFQSRFQAFFDDLPEAEQPILLALLSQAAKDEPVEVEGYATNFV